MLMIVDDCSNFDFLVGIRHEVVGNDEITVAI